MATTGGYYLAHAHGLEIEETQRAGVVGAVERSTALAWQVCSLSASSRSDDRQCLTLRAFSSGSRPFAAALIEAVADLRAGKVDEAIVGAVDSLVNQNGRALARLGLLKSPENPAGISPVRARHFIRLTRAASASRDQPPLAWLTQVGWDKESAHGLSNAGSDEKALLGLLADAPPSAQSAALPLIVGTLNGDPVRAMEWGTALVSLPPWASGADHLYPAASFGDTGAAAGAMNVVFALRTLPRSRAGYPSALVWAGGDNGGRAVVWLQPTNGRGSAS